LFSFFVEFSLKSDNEFTIQYKISLFKLKTSEIIVKFKFIRSNFLLMQMNEEKIVEELKQLKKKLERIQNTTRTTNILLAMILISILLISAFIVNFG